MILPHAPPFVRTLLPLPSLPSPHLLTFVSLCFILLDADVPSTLMTALHAAHSVLLDVPYTEYSQHR